MSTANDLADATTFDRISPVNMAIVRDAIAKRGTCDCEPYESVFNYGRWKKLGYQVQRGEKSFCRTRQFGRDEDTGRTYPKWSYMFCICQVKVSGTPEN
jgi:hypothetical protein